MHKLLYSIKLAHLFVATCVASAFATAQEPAAKSDRILTLFVCGDSTARNGAERGWASHLQPFFDSAKLKVENRAIAGRSSRTFVSEGRWDRVAAELQPGDFVLVQFGHNDGGPIDMPPARGSIRGIGDESREVTLPNGNKEVVHTYGWYFRKFVADTRSKGAVPIILSHIARNDWRNGKVIRPQTYPVWAGQVAAAEKCLFVDVHTIIADRYDQLGQEAVAPYFPEEHTHPSAAGSKLNAELTVAGLRGLEGRPLDRFLADKGQAVAAIRPPDSK